MLSHYWQWRLQMATLFLAAAGATVLVRSRRSSAEVPSAIPGFEARDPQFAAITFGEEIDFVFIGSVHCPWSTRTETIRAVQTAIIDVSHEAAAARVGFRAVGIAIDESPATGLAYLRSVGHFDEIATGGGWLNASAFPIVWGDAKGVGATPEVVVIERLIQDTSATPEGPRLVVRDRKVLMRAIGLPQLLDWVGRNAPVSISDSGSALGGGG